MAVQTLRQGASQCEPCRKFHLHKKRKPHNPYNGRPLAKQAVKIERIIAVPVTDPDVVASDVALAFGVRRSRLLDRISGTTTQRVYAARDELVVRLREGGMSSGDVAEFVGRTRVAINMATSRASKRRRLALDTSNVP